MVSFPAPLSLCVVTSLMGSLLAAIIQFAMEGNLNFGTSSLSFKAILGIVLLVLKSFAYTTLTTARTKYKLILHFFSIFFFRAGSSYHRCLCCISNMVFEQEGTCHGLHLQPNSDCLLCSTVCLHLGTRH